MALHLEFTTKETNDNKRLIIVDTTTDWGVGGNPSKTDIDAVDQILQVTISTMTSDSVITYYEPINLYASIPFIDENTVEYELNPSLLVEVGETSSKFTSNDVFVDGIYIITFEYTDSVTPANDSSAGETFMILGIVKNGVYEMLRKLNTNYDNELTTDSREMRETMFAKAYYDGIKANVYISEWSNALAQLFTLERMIENGSNNTW